MKKIILGLIFVSTLAYGAAKIQNADIKSNAAIDATKLIDGSVSNTELGYINSLTSNAQTQLGNKLDSSSFTDSAVTSKLLTGYVSGAGVVSATDSILQAIQKLNGNIAAIPAGGDFSSNTATSVDGEVVLFSGTGGKTGKRATGSGIAKLTSGVLGTATSGTDYQDPISTDSAVSNQFLTGFTAPNTFTRAQPSFSNISGTATVAQGGTGQTTYTDGQLLIGNSSGNTLSKATLTAGSNITITNGNGSITIASTGGSSSVGLVGIMKISGCTSGNFDTTSTSYAALGTSSGCTYTPTNGSATFSTPGTNVVGFTTTSIPAGTYQITYTGAVTNNNSNGKYCYFQFSDGTTTANEDAETINATQTHTTPTFTQTITFASSGAHTIDIRGKMESGGNGNCRIGGDVNGTRIGSQTITMVRVL